MSSKAIAKSFEYRLKLGNVEKVNLISKNAPRVIKIRSLFPFTKLCELAVTSVKMMNSERFLVAP